MLLHLGPVGLCGRFAVACRTAIPSTGELLGGLVEAGTEDVRLARISVFSGRVVLATERGGLFLYKTSLVSAPPLAAVRLQDAAGQLIDEIPWLDGGRWPELRLDLAALERELGQVLEQAQEKLNLGGNR